MFISSKWASRSRAAAASEIFLQERRLSGSGDDTSQHGNGSGHPSNDNEEHARHDSHLQGGETSPPPAEGVLPEEEEAATAAAISSKLN